MRHRLAWWSLVPAAMPVPGTAHAHLVETGFGGFYDGMAHLAMTPEDLLAVVAIALLAGQKGTVAARLAVIALPMAWLVGGLIGARWTDAGTLPLLTTLTFAATGALVAMNARIRDAGVATVAIAAGVLHGLANGATMGLPDLGGQALFGAVSASLVLTILLSSQVAVLPAGWPQVMVRIAGSWIAATGLLMFGWFAHSMA